MKDKTETKFVLSLARVRECHIFTCVFKLVQWNKYYTFVIFVFIILAYCHFSGKCNGRGNYVCEIVRSSPAALNEPDRHTEIQKVDKYMALCKNSESFALLHSLYFQFLNANFWCSLTKKKRPIISENTFTISNFKYFFPSFSKQTYQAWNRVYYKLNT
jgi:hypothetical protein